MKDEYVVPGYLWFGFGFLMGSVSVGAIWTMVIISSSM